MPLVSSSHPYRAVIDESASGDRTIVAAVTEKHIVVVNVAVTLGSGQTIIWKSGSVALSGAFETGYTAGDSYAGLFETAVNEALILNLSAAAAVDGHLTYVLLA